MMSASPLPARGGGPIDAGGPVVATRADVAKRAGVSTSTVSYALSGARPISEETRRRVLAAMEELGYTPNMLASGLAGRRSRIIALLFPSQPRHIAGTDLEYVVAAADAARERGYHVVLWTMSEGDLDEIMRLSTSGLVDGVLLMEVRMRDARVEPLSAAGIPLTLIGRTADDGELIYADADFDASARLAVRRLAELGHRDVGFVNAPPGILDLGYGAAERMELSVRAAAGEAGLTLVSVPCEHTAAAGRAALGEMLATAPATTGVISFNWEATVGMMQEARTRGIRVPEKLSIIAFAPTWQADLTVPPLTTVTLPAAAIGRAAALALIDHLERPDGAPTRILLPGSLIERGSCAPAPDAASGS